MKSKTLLSGILIATLLSGCIGCGQAQGATPSSDSDQEINNDSSASTGSSLTNAENGSDPSTSDASSAESNSSSSSDIASEATTVYSLEDSTPLKDLCSDYFALGVGINGSTLENQTLNIPEYMEYTKYHFNSCTMTNLMKSGYILDWFGCQDNISKGIEEPALNFASIDPTLEWCKENGVQMRGHTLVWHTQAPDWFFRVDYKDDGEYVDKDTMLMRMESYIKQLVTHVQEEYPGVIYCWDVVNEAVEPDSYDPDSYFMCRTKVGNDPNPWYETIGPDYVEMAFTYARKYVDKDVKLFYNDYNTYQEPKTQAIYDLCSHLKEKGLIDGIGMQGYWGIDYPSDDMIKNAIEKFAELGLEIHITELSIGVDEETDEQFQKQADRYAQVFQLLHDMDTDAGGPANITCVTVFGLVDHYREGDTTNTRIFDSNYQPKAAYYSIVDTMKNY